MTRAAVRHLAANKISIICGNAQLIANHPALKAKELSALRAKAELIDRDARRFLDELMAMFADPDDHLGAVEATHRGEI